MHYQGEECLDVIGIWKYGFSQQLWIMTHLEPEVGLKLYCQWMKIEICFRDLKCLLHIDKVMNKSHSYLEKMLAMILLACGRGIRDVQYVQVPPDKLNLL